MTDGQLIELLTIAHEMGADGEVRYKNSTGQLHRMHGPAVIYPDGTEVWYQRDKFHRIDGPAVIMPSGSQFWYQMDKLHRIDGPAKILFDGKCQWYLDGIPYPREVWELRRVATP